jgi:G3E family GTPase
VPAPTDVTPTLLVTGFLGAGKTTLLRGWLAARPPGARWAVLVNEFGALGVDRALLGAEAGPAAAGAEAGEVAVVEIAGGCACCAARVAFAAALTRLLRRGPWDRLFIETTGLGHPAELVDQLRAAAFAARLRVLPPVAVVDTSRARLYTDPSRAGHATALDQVALARLLVLNRAGAVPADEAGALVRTLAALPPWPRIVLPTPTGEVPLAAVLDALAADGSVGMGAADAPPASTQAPAPLAPPERDAPSACIPPAPAGTASPETLPAAGPMPSPMHWRRSEPGVAEASGWWWPAAAGFDRRRLQAALEALSGPGGPLQACGLLRGKGVFRTERAWYAWQWVDGVAAWSETAWRADSRFEVLAERPPDPQMVEQRLRSAAMEG